MGCEPRPGTTRSSFTGRMSFRTAILVAILVTGSASTSLAASCKALLSAKINNVTITGAAPIPAGSFQPPGSAVAFPDLPAFCRVTATVAAVPDSSVAIELWLPQNWNGRYQQVGNHGYGSGIHWNEMAPQLRRGFATAATDDGHAAKPAAPYDVSWAIGHPAKLEDFAYRAVHELAENAKLLIAAFYGRPQREAYFNGCSDGGREGLREAQQFPGDFNGILIGGVASHWTAATAQQIVDTANYVRAGMVGDRGKAVLALELRAAIQGCDGGDGVSDGIISDPAGCHFDPNRLVCKAGQDPSTCLTPAQASALLLSYEPVRDPDTGGTVSANWMRGAETDEIRFGYYKGLARFAVGGYQIATGNPRATGTDFQLHRDLPRLRQSLGIMDTLAPDLSAFRAGGGKMIQYHGWSDAAFPPEDEIKYYRSVVDSLGNGEVATIQRFYRLFMEPGVGHCGTGVGPDNIGTEGYLAVSNDDRHDVVSALTDWVENNKAPAEFIASKNRVDGAGDGVVLQRPVCPYPAASVYDGKGDASSAGSFHCEEPTTVPGGPANNGG